MIASRKNPVSRVAAIHDLSGFGKSSLTVIIPILSAMGIQVCPVPTAVLTTHTNIANFRLRDLTDFMSEFTEHWAELGLSFDAIYSGFLGSASQVEIVLDFIERFSENSPLVVVDPVLGDNGELYSSIDQSFVEQMRRLVARAGIITPNLTEAALLLDRPFRTDLELKQMKDWARELAQLGPETVIITSVPEKTETSVIAFDNHTHSFWRVSARHLQANYPGTGDAFTSVIVGSLLQGDSLPVALDRAVHFISSALRATFGYSLNPQEGILFERMLDQLKLPIQNYSYELLDDAENADYRS